MTAAICRFVSYPCIPTDCHGRFVLGLEAQRQAVAAHVVQSGGALLAEFQEAESGKRAGYPQFAAALSARRTRRSVLLTANLERSARNARSLRYTVVGSSEAGIVFCDLPKVLAKPIGRFLVAQMATVAELEDPADQPTLPLHPAVAKARSGAGQFLSAARKAGHGMGGARGA